MKRNKGKEILVEKKVLDKVGIVVILFNLLLLGIIINIPLLITLGGGEELTYKDRYHILLWQVVTTEILFFVFFLIATTDEEDLYTKKVEKIRILDEKEKKNEV